MNPHSNRPTVEQLGTRVLPSATPLLAGSVAAVAGQLKVPARVTTVTDDRTAGLNGSVHGTLTRFTEVPADLGQRFSQAGSDAVAGLGTFDVKGIPHGNGLIAMGRASGLLTLSNSLGGITNRLQGPEQPRFASLPSRFSFSVAGGSGAYAHFHAAGTATLAVQTHGSTTDFRLALA
jgi:hypothetical protein